MSEIAFKKIWKILDSFKFSIGYHELLSDIFEVSAIEIANSVEMFPSKKREEREKAFNAIMRKYKAEDAEKIKLIFCIFFELLGDMTENGFDDYLGRLYMSSQTSSNKAGQFFTPFNLSKLSAEMCIKEDVINECKKNGEVLTIAEPACGSGGMLIAALDVLWNKYSFNYAENLLIDCGDVDRRCVHMAYIQLSLAGVPAVVRHANTLTMEQWDEWHTPALCMQYLKFRKHLKR